MYSDSETSFMANKEEFMAILKECKDCIKDIEWEIGKDILVSKKDIKSLKIAWGELEYTKELLK